MKRSIKICHITTVHPASDIRIFKKECISLASEGYDVSLIAKYNKEVTINDVKIIPFPEFRNRFFRIFFSPIKMFFMALKQKAIVYHFHDPELIFVGILLRIFGKKVIYDVHEDIAKQVLYKDWIKSKPIKKLTGFLISLIEKIGALFFSGIVTVTAEIEGKFNASKTFLVRNMPVLELITRSPPATIKKEKPIIIYSGGLTRVRGIKELVEAMEWVGDKAEIWLLGKWESDAFFEECQKIKGWDYCKYKGFLSQEEMYSTMKICDIGIVPFLPFPNHINALPNKPFEYMACSLPIIMSDFPSWRNIFKGCSLFVDPEKPGDIAEKINLLLADKQLSHNLSSKGKDLILDEYSWESEKNNLLKIYSKIKAKT